MLRAAGGSPLLGEREHQADLAAEDGFGMLTGLPAGLDACGTSAMDPGLPGATELIDPALQPVGLGLWTPAALVQLVDLVAQSRPVSALPTGRVGVNAQLAVTLRSGGGEALVDALEALASGVAPGDAAFEPVSGPREVTAMLLTAPLQADDLPVRAPHGALGAELSCADGGHAIRAFRCHSRRNDAFHGEHQQEHQQGDQRSCGRRPRDVLGRGSEHALDGRDGRCAPAPPGRRTPPGPSTRRDGWRHEAAGRRCSIGT